RRRRTAGNHHAPLRAHEHVVDVEQTGRRLGKAARRQCCRHRHAGSPATSRTRSQVRSAQLANKNREPRRNPMTKPRPIRRPGKSSPATSRFVIQGPPQRSFTKRMAIETQNPSQSQPSRPTCKGSESPLPSEPAPRLRPWMQMALILEVQTDEFWQDVTLPLLENVRKKLRALM